MMQTKAVKISVRNLVEAVLRSGDIDYKHESRDRLLEGTLGHQKLQRKYKKQAAEDGYEYLTEVPVYCSFLYHGFSFEVDGRIDGIELAGENIIIDEIKTTGVPMEQLNEAIDTHWAQVKCYAYIYALMQKVQNLNIRMIYFNTENEETRSIMQSYDISALEEFFYGIIEKYYYWVRLQYDWCEKRNQSIQELKFPFEAYRKGQRQLAVAVYRTINSSGKLFAQAPTGIGKTISTLFPAIKAMGEGHGAKLFYLTAKTITRQVAEETICMMVERGLELRSVTITAKDKICFMEKAACSPEDCEFAKGHFNRVNNAVLYVVNNNKIISREIIEEAARTFKVCPYELSLDVALLTDCIICDYNYAFDPRVQLRRFFADRGGDYTFLVDESHNLVDRARSMYSAEIWKKPFLQIKRMAKARNASLWRLAANINSCLLELKKQCSNSSYVILEEEPKELLEHLYKLMNALDKQLPLCESSEEQAEMLDLYFSILTFLRIAELYDEAYLIYVERSEGDVRLKYYCIDPSRLLNETFKKGRAAILFSATLAPIDYYKELLSQTEGDYRMRLESPFERTQLCVLSCGKVSTKYKNRENSYWDVTEYIETLVMSKTGNFIAYFPSYKYMSEISQRFAEKHPEIKTIIQKPVMSESEKEEFLDEFISEPKETLLGFAVMGGIFSEGIDLTGERLSGVVIVGVGLPQLCLERDLISDYYQKRNGSGYQYSYMYPGMNKVLQAAGRVIRTERDRGIIMLIDERYERYDYQKLFPDAWSAYKSVRSVSEARNHIESFWRAYTGKH